MWEEPENKTQADKTMKKDSSLPIAYYIVMIFNTLQTFYLLCFLPLWFHASLKTEHILHLVKKEQKSSETT